MRIHGDVWFVVQVRTSDPTPLSDNVCDEILVGTVSDMLSWAGQFGVDDIRGKFTTKREAVQFSKKQKVK